MYLLLINKLVSPYAMKIRTTSSMRANLQENFDQVHYNKEPIIVTKNRKLWVTVGPIPENDKELQKLVNRELHK